MNLTFRQANPNDADLIRTFEHGLIEHERAIEPTIRSTGDIHYYNIPELIESDNSVILIAEIDDKPIGCGAAIIKKNASYSTEPTHSYLGLMYVEKAHRGQGISKKLINELIEWSKAKGVNEIRLEAYENNPDAIRAYERTGFRTNYRNIIYHQS